MQFSIEKKISNFIENQFPRFYQEEGDNFILFAKAYYEWMESNNPLVDSSNNVILNSDYTSLMPPIYGARNLLDYRDIDNTLDAFLDHFQKKYLYGIPFDVIVNKRYLLKHILDVYRSKGSIQCYKLLFKLIYGQDVDVYLPSEDMLKISDGTWTQPRYLEVNDNGSLSSYVGQTIVGVTSGTTAIIEELVRNAINRGITCNLALSNISPVGGYFIKGEKIIIQNQNTPEDIAAAPVVLGSLDYLNIINGGQNYNVGDVLKIAQYDPTTNKIVSSGTNGRLRVTSVSRQQGSIAFNIISGGFGYIANANIFFYKGDGDTTGNGASFQLGSLSYLQNINYNTDLICDYLSKAINSSTYALPGNAAANSTAQIVPSLKYTTSTFGSIATLANTSSGNGYTQTPYVFVRSTQLSKTLPGTVNISTSSNTITGTSTTFKTYFANGDVIALQANSTVIDYQIIRTVTSDTSILLYGPSKYSNTVATVKAAPVILPSNFSIYSPLMARSDNTIDGKNEIISANPSAGNNIVKTVTAIGSGKGYIDNELVKAYRYNALTIPVIANGGNNYSNNDSLSFSSVDNITVGNGYVTTNATGGITAVIMNSLGSGYIQAPTVTVNSNNRLIVSNVTNNSTSTGYSNTDYITFSNNSLNAPYITAAGSHYSNNDSLTISGTAYATPASGHILTNNTGGVTSVILDNIGSGYLVAPSITVSSNTQQYISALAINGNTVGYSNSDYITISNTQNQFYSGNASITTDSTGKITAVTVSNTGLFKSTQANSGLVLTVTNFYGGESSGFGLGYSSFKGYISANTLTVVDMQTALASYYSDIVIGQRVSGPGVTSNTSITAFVSGSGGVGTYTLNKSQTVGSSGTPINMISTNLTAGLSNATAPSGASIGVTISSNNQFYSGNASITTDSSGKITSVAVSNTGLFSNNQSISGLAVTIANSIGGSSAGSGANISFSLSNTAGGSGAILTTFVQEYDTTSSIQGFVVKNGVGRDEGNWSSTNGFLNSDKYIQDSYFYQDYSYQIRAAITLDKYKDILYNTFHSAGSELFGDFYLIDNEKSLAVLEFETYNAVIGITSDSTYYTSDMTGITSDMFVNYGLTSDISTITSDSTLYTSDNTC